METIAKIENIIPKLFQLDRNKLYDIKIEEHKEKRSLNANSYLWLLCTKIANKLTNNYVTITKEDVYIKMLKSYGQSLLIPVTLNSKPDGYFKYYDYHGRSILNGKVADWYIVYKGSSEYNTYEMTVLLNGVIEECKNLDIETKSQEEIDSLLGDWL
ncbi:MAG: hypothetical protein ACI4VQ_01340 [Clostridia bacterium]